MAREGADVRKHQAGHGCREQAETGPGEHRRNGRREAEYAEHQERKSERQRRRKAQTYAHRRSGTTRAAIDQLSSAAWSRAF